MRDAGLELSGYCRGGMFTSDATRRGEVRDDNRRAVDEAKALGAPCIVLVAGTCRRSRGQGNADLKDIAAARKQVHDAIAEMLEYAKQADVPLRSNPCIRPMPRPRLRKYDQQALDICDQLDPQRTGASAWRSTSSTLWCMQLISRFQFARVSRLRLAGARKGHPQQPRHDGRRRRGRSAYLCNQAIEAQGFAGYCESRNLLQQRSNGPMDEVLKTCIERHRTVV